MQSSYLRVSAPSCLQLDKQVGGLHVTVEGPAAVLAYRVSYHYP